MCGICGFSGFKDQKLLEKMTKTLYHRGPDDSGFYYSDGEIYLGQRRLSIIDLNTGHQPIFNEDKSIVIVFNGEIYNYKALREELIKRGHIFYTQSDTEVIVHCYEEYGIDCVKLFNGCFAFAIFDRNKKILFLARDRLGIRPIYYYHNGKQFIFASEIKSLLLCPYVDKIIDNVSVDRYLTLRYVPGMRTMFKNIFRLPAASVLSLTDSRISISKFWSVDFTIEQNKKPGEYVEEFQVLLEDAVKLRMVSDVPIGAYLSGGVDSSGIVALMKRFSRQKIKTYTIGFGTDIDETAQAKAISRYLDTEHHEMSMDIQSYDLLPKILWHLDEPIGDAIIIPTYLLARETARSVKVVLTGEGADEILAGYVHHISLYFGHRYLQMMPRFIRENFINKIVKALPAKLLDKLFLYPASLGARGKDRLLGYLDSLENNSQAYLKFASIFSEPEKKELYSNPFLIDAENDESLEQIYGQFLNKDSAEFLNNVIGLDLNYWLPDYTLLKQDRLAMANSLEARVPYLDHRIVEFCAKLPIDLKLKGFTQKYLLRASLEGILPKQTVWARKKAFYFPTEKCFKGTFDDYARDLLNAEVIRRRGIFNPRVIQKLLEKPRGSELLENKQVMSLVILENWMRLYADGEGFDR